MSPKDRSEAELWKALEALGDDPLDPSMPREVAPDDAVRSAGVDPDKLKTARGRVCAPRYSRNTASRGR